MTIDQHAATIAPALKWHDNGRYLNKDECLAEVIRLRRRAGRSAVLSAEEQNLSLEEAHALLTTEMRADYEATIQHAHERLHPPASAARACLWFALGALGLSSPYLLEAGIGPDWFQWLLKGSGGHAQSWQGLGALVTALGLVETLAWMSERTGIAAFGFAANCLRVLFVIGITVGCIGFVAIFGALMLGVVINWLSPFLPTNMEVMLRDFDREPDSFYLAGAIVLMIAASFAVTYYRSRARKPEEGPFAVIGTAAYASFEPFLLFTLIALKAFVWIFMILIALSHWPPFTGPWSPWIEEHERILVMYGMIGSLLAPFPLHFARIRLHKSPPDKPTFAGSCWIVIVVLTGVGLLVLAMALLASGLQSIK